VQDASASKSLSKSVASKLQHSIARKPSPLVPMSGTAMRPRKRAGSDAISAAISAGVPAGADASRDSVNSGSQVVATARSR
jgi:hypothetical protein